MKFYHPLDIQYVLLVFFCPALHLLCNHFWMAKTIDGRLSEQSRHAFSDITKKNIECLDELDNPILFYIFETNTNNAISI